MTRGRRNPLCHDFPIRLRRARQERGLARAQLSKAAGLAPDTVRALEATKRVPRVDTVHRLAETLGMSPAWLAYGLGEKETVSPKAAGSFQQRLRRARQDAGLTQARLGTLAGTKGTTVSAMELNGNVPDIVRAEQLARALGVSPGWLAFGDTLGTCDPEADQT